jgi:hypothetical protein
LSYSAWLIEGGLPVASFGSLKRDIVTGVARGRGIVWAMSRLIDVGGRIWR